MFKVARNEGVGALYNGLTPALLRQASYSSIRMGIYEPVRDLIAGKDVKIEDIPFWKRAAAGGTAGAIGIAIANPTELIKVRMQADRTRTRYPNGIIDAFRQTARQEGIFGFWKGVNPNMIRAYIVNAAELATYDQAKTLLVAKAKMDPDSKVTHLISSIMAGIVAAFFSQPVDLVKNRYMSQPAGPGITPKYRGMLDCFIKVAKTEGFTSLYRGVVANAARLGSWCVVMFMSYEQYRIFARRLYTNPSETTAHK